MQYIYSYPNFVKTEFDYNSVDTGEVREFGAIAKEAKAGRGGYMLLDQASSTGFGICYGGELHSCGRISWNSIDEAMRKTPETVVALASAYDVGVVYCEDIFLGDNVQTAFALAELKGAIQSHVRGVGKCTDSIPVAYWRNNLFKGSLDTTLDPKQKVKNIVVRKYPFLANETCNDVTDAVGMCMSVLSKGMPEIGINKKIRYEMALYAGITFDDAFEKFIKDKRVFKKVSDSFVVADYNTGKDVNYNVLRTFTDFDKLAMLSVIPYHRYSYKMFFDYDLKANENSVVLLVAVRT